MVELVVAPNSSEERPGIGRRDWLEQKANGMTDLMPKRIPAVHGKSGTGEDGRNHNRSHSDGAEWAKVEEKPKPRNYPEDATAHQPDPAHE